MSKVLSYTAQAVARGGDPPHVETPDGALSADLCTPEELGGAGGEGTNAEQLLAAGYAACLLSALRLAALQRQADVTGAEVRAVVELQGSERFEASVRLEAQLPSLPVEAARELLAAACEAWPYAVARGGKLPEVGLASSARSPSELADEALDARRGGYS